MPKELKWSLLKRPGGVVQATVTSVEKPPDKLLKNAYEYESRFRKELAAVYPFTRLDLIIDSNGGAVSSACGISAAVLAAKRPVRVLIDGECGSAATLVAYGTGGKVYITPRSHIMIHMPKVVVCKRSGGIWSFFDKIGKTSTINYMLCLYRHKTRRPKAELRKMLRESRRFSSTEAVMMNFADAITTLETFRKGE